MMCVVVLLLLLLLFFAAVRMKSSWLFALHKLLLYICLPYSIVVVVGVVVFFSPVHTPSGLGDVRTRVRSKYHQMQRLSCINYTLSFDIEMWNFQIGKKRKEKEPSCNLASLAAAITHAHHTPSLSFISNSLLLLFSFSSLFCLKFKALLCVFSIAHLNGCTHACLKPKQQMQHNLFDVNFCTLWTRSHDYHRQF